MLLATVEFLLGTYRADPDGTAQSGALQRGEWPPTPMRLFSALVAADGTRERCRFTDGSELRWLEQQSPPRIVACDRSEVSHTPQIPRFVVKQQAHSEKGQAQEYVGRSSIGVRPGVRSSPRTWTVHFLWDNEPPSDTLESLKIRAARIGYLGCSDSPVRLTFSTTDETPDGAAYNPDGAGSCWIGVPAPGSVDLLDRHFDNWQTRGPSLRRSQSLGLDRPARYRAPSEAPPVALVESPAVLWFVLSERVNGRQAVRLTELLRATLLSRFDESDHPAPSVLHGHGVEGRGYDTARFLALANVGGERSDGAIHGLAVWFPSGTDDATVEACRQALHGQIELRSRSVRASITPWAGQKRPWAANPARWTQVASCWASVFPVVHERFGERPDAATVARWCSHAGLPDPVAVRSARAPFITGGINLSMAETSRQGRPQRPFSHLEVVFAEPLQGPLALGAGRQFGLGLLAPTDTARGDS